jgi:prevent-host-death family protein
MVDTVNIHEAKTHLSRLLERVRRGATITIAKAGTPVALLVPVGEPPSARLVREPSGVSRTGVRPDRATRLARFLEQEVWPVIPDGEAGRVLTRDEEDEILGYGPEGA